jgi:flagellar motor switch protein FliN
MTSDEALLLLGESVADAIADFLRNLAPDGVERSPVTLAMKGEMALQGLPAIGVVSFASYVGGSSGGNLMVMSRGAARKLALLAAGEDPKSASEGPISKAELARINAATSRLFDTAAATTEALLGEGLQLAPPETHPFDTPGEAFVGIDLAPRATAVTYTVAGETFRIVDLIPNVLLIRMTQVFDDRAAAQTADRFDGGELGSVPPDRVRDVKVTLRAELGRTRLSLVQATSLDSGAAVMLDRLVDDPVELVVNGRRFGTGELVSTGGRWAVRIREITGVRG